MHGSRIDAFFTPTKADAVINACGVFSDRLRTMADPKATPIMIPGPGTHLILPDYASPDAMGLVWFTRDGQSRSLARSRLVIILT